MFMYWNKLIKIIAFPSVAGDQTQQAHGEACSPCPQSEENLGLDTIRQEKAAWCGIYPGIYLMCERSQGLLQVSAVSPNYVADLLETVKTQQWAEE